MTSPRPPAPAAVAALAAVAAPAARATLAALAALAAALAPAAAAQDPPASALATISGTVRDALTRRPIESVIVELPSRGFRFHTDAAGRFTFANVPVGDYRLVLSHPDYHPAVGDFTIMRSGEFETFMDPVNAAEDELVTGIVGVVSDAQGGGALGGASVRVLGSGQSAVADARGRFTLDEIGPGPHLVEFAQLGYQSRADTIEVLPGRVTSVRVSLSADPIQLEPIEVAVERRETALQDAGFYGREAEGFGEFIDREAIENQRPAEMSDLFTRLPGVQLYADPNNPLEKYVLLRGGRSASFSGRCFPRVFLDGMVVSNGGSDPAQLDRFIDPEAVSGVEVFSSSSGVPAQYAGVGTFCGVILIWTRR